MWSKLYNAREIRAGEWKRSTNIVHARNIISKKKPEEEKHNFLLKKKIKNIWNDTSGEGDMGEMYKNQISILVGECVSYAMI